MRIETKQTLVFVAALLVLLTSCGRKSKEIGERAVARFHDQFNAGQYHDIYAQAEEGTFGPLPRGSGEADTLAWLDTVHRKLGTVKTANETEWHVRHGTEVNLIYDTQFTEGNAREYFVFDVSGDNARLSNYNIESPLLTIGNKAESVPEDMNPKGAAKDGILNGKAIKLPKPPYPPIAKATKAQGTVVIQVLVDENGDVILAHAVSGDPLLQAAALAAARQAKFPPRIVSGKSIKVSGVITYEFTPD
jgi:TonB family protein